MENQRGWEISLIYGRAQTPTRRLSVHMRLSKEKMATLKLDSRRAGRITRSATVVSQDEEGSIKVKSSIAQGWQGTNMQAQDETNKCHGSKRLETHSTDLTIV